MESLIWRMMTTPPQVEDAIWLIQSIALNVLPPLDLPRTFLNPLHFQSFESYKFNVICHYVIISAIFGPCAVYLIPPF